jgi:exodeoxyribonuclease VII large subunit
MKTPVISAVGHETDFTICDFVADLRAPTPSAAAELAVPDIHALLQDLDMRYDRLTDTMSAIIEEEREKLQDYLDIFKKTGLEQIRFKEEQVKGIVGKIDSLNPLSVLARGYSVATKAGKAVKSIQELSIGDRVMLRFSDGQAETIIEKKGE